MCGLPQLVVQRLAVDSQHSCRFRLVSATLLQYIEDVLAFGIGIMKGGKLLMVGTAEELKRAAGKDKFEEAFVAIVKGETI